MKIEKYILEKTEIEVYNDYKYNRLIVNMGNISKIDIQCKEYCETLMISSDEDIRNIYIHCILMSITKILKVLSISSKKLFVYTDTYYLKYFVEIEKIINMYFNFKVLFNPAEIKDLTNIDMETLYQQYTWKKHSYHTIGKFLKEYKLKNLCKQLKEQDTLKLQVLS